MSHRATRYWMRDALLRDPAWDVQKTCNFARNYCNHLLRECRCKEVPDLLADKSWQERLALLCKYHMCCEIEIFAPQLPDLTAVASSYPDIQFILPAMGRPIDLTDFSASERRKLFHDTATTIYGLASADRSQQEGSHIGRLG